MFRDLLCPRDEPYWVTSCCVIRSADDIGTAEKIAPFRWHQPPRDHVDGDAAKPGEARRVVIKLELAEPLSHHANKAGSQSPVRVMSLSHCPWSLSRFSKCLAFSFRCVYWPKRPPREEGERLLSGAAGSRRVISPLCFFIIRSWMNCTRDTTACPRGWNPSILGRGEARGTRQHGYSTWKHGTLLFSEAHKQDSPCFYLSLASFVCHSNKVVG